ncbi:CSLREA domain-containing protein [Acinetobacter pittii]|uniref:CSLREA domain-containing protein n=4 Tax=Acinetobacter TaxID=469 RepID=A0A8I1H6N3_ACIPI|nr:CSLREA domain-containing protein [Acinetobacter pittii]MBF9204005.1 CSLREA domain-containing protein [Acinetobacter pittii]MBK1443367.1 CSLREA domain-containing protein [Acinetobacter pittii]MBQ5174937.1 CSLREA domain-containing protein [Acinetobacter pittii]MBW8291716.1 CSLREA domain-containing protein [Acinetobacter pittii]MCF1279879.1 CSLREA domain-containing protein [Acinetobacter pittii]
MKNYKKALLALAVLANMPLFADTTNKRIEVTTFADEDGENTNACSLREAIKVAETRKSAYGCTVFSLDTDQVIQLKAGTYTLNKELVPNANISIYGYGEREEDKIWSEKNVLTNDYPALPELKTRINAAGKSRIFNTAENQKALFLQNIILENGIASNQGGAIYAGGNVTLLNSQILNSQAPKGGAVFLGGSGVNLSITHSLLQGNQASAGSVLAMSCKNGTEYAKREVTLTSSSIIKNGSSNSASTFEFCGEPKATFTINTIAQNIASTVNGVILKFTGDAIPGNTTNPSTILSGGSSLKLQNNTIVENNAHTTFLYDSLGGKELNFNIIGYNPVGYACRYLAGSAADLKNSGLRLSFNALNLSNNTDKCDLPTEVLSSANKTIDISGVPFNSLLERHEKAAAVTGFLPLYFPLVAAGKEDLIDVDPEGKAICADIDQRGLARLPTNKLYYQPDNIARNSCDIGSVELMKLTAGDLRGLGNSSLTTLLEGYQTQYDTAEKNLTNPLYSYLWNVLKIDLANYKNLLDQTKANAKYRAIYIDLKANGLPLPNEDSSHLLKFFNSTDYNISLESVGTGLIDDKVASTEKDDKLFCEWNSALQQIIFYRSDDITTQAGDYNYCKYTISSKDGSTQSSGLLEARFDNVAPVASDSKVVFQYLANEIIPLNLLKYANDDGDGPANTLITKPNKPQFADLPIYLPSKTSKDGIFTVVKADREGPCPGEDKDNTCYGGNIYIQAKNSFNNFNDTLTYYVYDADNKISNAGTISLVSSNTTAGGGNSGGGGGSLGILSLASLLGLAAYRRYRK